MDNNHVNLKIRDFIVSSLTFAAGFIDALSFLILGGVFASFMSGNTLTLGLRIGTGDFPLALNSMAAILGYIGGVALGANIGYPTLISDKIWPQAVTKILTVEFLMIIVFTSLGLIEGHFSSNVVYILVLLVSISMGLQSAAVRVLGISGVSTTYVTGTWTTFIINLVTIRRSHDEFQRTVKRKQDTIIQVLTLVAYVMGAATGGMMVPHFLFKATIIPLCIFGFVLIVVWRRFHQTD